MERRLSARIGSVALGLALAAAVGFAGGGPADDAALSEDSAPSESPVPLAGGLRVYLDPETGEVRSRPADQDPELQREESRWGERESRNTYGGDLLQEPLDGGGFMVDLRGRFQSSVVATIDPETGAVTVDCVRAPAAGESEDEDAP